MIEEKQEIVVAASDSRPLSAAQIKAQVNLIQEVMASVMKEGVHYGVVPGCGDKPTLLKAGAEKLCQTFRLAPQIEEEDLGDGKEIRYRVKVRLVHAPTGQTVGEGIGEGSSLESKWAWKGASDEEYEATIETERRIKWVSRWDRQANRKVGVAEKQIRQNQADVANTILKMTKKRALVDAVLTATAASDIFSQDLEEIAPEDPFPAQARASNGKSDSEELPLSQEEENAWKSLVMLSQTIVEKQQFVEAKTFWSLSSDYTDKSGKNSHVESLRAAEEKVRFYAEKGWDKKFIGAWLGQARKAYMTGEDTKVVAGFSKAGVPQHQLESALGFAAARMDAATIEILRKTYRSMVDQGIPFADAIKAAKGVENAQ